VIALLWSCGDSNLIIEGKINNGKDVSVYLSKLNIDGAEFVDSTKLSADGVFKFKCHTDYPQLYVLALSNGNIITTVAHAEDNLFFEGNAEDFALSYKVKGSDDAEKAKIIADHLYNTKKSLEGLYAELKNKSRDKASIEKEITSTINKQRKFSADFIIANGTSLSAYIALYQKLDNKRFTLNENKDIYYFRVIASSLKALYPESQYTKGILSSLDLMTKRLADARLKELIKNAPNSLPEIKLANAKDKEIKLSSLKGKYILLDFTVLSNYKSVGLNKHYKNLYKKYKKRGLEIYQVCLDKDTGVWKNALKEQSIKWKAVYNDKQSVALQNWNIQRVPSNFIINKDFTIAGKNLFGENLDKKLKEIIR
jgi:peroxiredoxin